MPTTFFHFTDESAFHAIVGAADSSGVFRPSGIFQAAHQHAAYGNGWYVTTLPPSTSTEALLANLWMSDPEKRHKTEYWLELDIGESQVTFPDRARPHVGLIPFFRRIPSADGSAVSVFGSGQEIRLRAGGRRAETGAGVVDTTELYRPVQSAKIFNAFLASITGVRLLPWRARKYLKDWLRIDDADDLLHVRTEELIHESHTLYQRGDLTAALSAIDAAIELDAEQSVAWSNRGAILAASGRREEALNAYDRAMTLDPSNVNAIRNAAAALLHLKRYSEARAMCERGLSIDPQNADIWSNYGAVHHATGNEDAALEAFDKALGLDSNIAQAWRNRGGIYANRASLTFADDRHAWCKMTGDAIDSFARAISCKDDYDAARVDLRTIVANALRTMPWAWPCEDSIWRATLADSECCQIVMAHFNVQHLEYHPKMAAVLEEAGIRDYATMARLVKEALIECQREGWDVGALFDKGNLSLEIGVCLLADWLGRSSFVGLAARILRLMVSDYSRWNSKDRGILLQIAKSLAAAARALRRAEAYQETIDFLSVARALYAHCGDGKFHGHMAFNLGVAYTMRSQVGDADQAKAAFADSFEQYDRLGLVAERESAEREIRALQAWMADE